MTLAHHLPSGKRSADAPRRATAIGWLLSTALLTGLLAGLPGSAMAQGAAGEQSTAFYYGAGIPLQEAALFGSIVVQPDQVQPFELAWLRDHDVRVFAYVSVGEAASPVPGVRMLARNPTWDTAVPDLTDPAWAAHLDALATRLAADYDGLFLDTLDSFNLVEPAQREAQRRALERLILGLSERFDGALILNRGFEVLDALAGRASMVVAEGLYSRFSPTDDSYGSAPEEDSAWLLARLEEARALGFRTQVLDYAVGTEARETMARRIQAAGHLPWVADGHLTQWGTGSLLPTPRRILSLYDSDDEYRSGVARLPLHRHLESFVEHLGYVIEYHNVADGRLPEVDPALHAGVLVWTPSAALYGPAVSAWLKDRLGQLPVLLLGAMPADRELLGAFGIARSASRMTGAPSVRQLDERLRAESTFERADPALLQATRPSTVEAEILLFVTDAGGRVMPQIAVNGNGGVVLQPWIVRQLPDRAQLWQIDPLAILRLGLRLPEIPRLDVTTENGRRVLLTHIDGDGMPSRSWFPHRKLAAEVVHEEVLKKYRVPTTVSVIEGEIAPHGLFPDLSQELEALARTIFARNDVEIASHSFSHPFFWPDEQGRIRGGEQGPDGRYGFHMPIPGYALDPEREIRGSIDYIQRRLAPEGKDVAMMLWTGEALVSEPSLALTREVGVLAMNGGNTRSDASTPSRSQVYPVGRHVARDLYQIYAPVMNENVYTNNWSPPYGGFRDVVETFALLDAPQRLKPLNIYYHFYSGAYPASLGALHHVYRSVLAQRPTAMYASDYVRRARGFYDGAVARDLAGRWHIHSAGTRTVRTPARWPEPAITSSVAGFSLHNGERYIHTVGDTVVLDLDGGDAGPYLLEANAILTAWHRERAVTRFTLEGHLPIELEFARAERCRLTLRDASGAERDIAAPVRVSLAAGRHDGTLSCDAAADRPR